MFTVRPSTRNAQHYDICELSVQELRNILEAFENPDRDWRWRNPWGSWIKDALKKAIKANDEYYGSKW